MAIVYKINVLRALKAAGYSSYKLRVNKIMGESVIQQLRRGELVSWAEIDKICSLLNCDISDIVEHKNDIK